MKIIKLYLRYFISISNVVIIGCLLSFLLLSYLMTLIDMNPDLSYNEISLIYFNNCIYYTKTVIIILSSFIFMKLTSERYEYIINIVVSVGYDKKRNYDYMMIANIIIIILINIIAFLLFLISGFFFCKSFMLKNEYLILFINILLLSIYYGFLSYLLNVLFKNQFIFISLIILFFISEIFIDINSAFKFVFLTIIPNINNINGNLFISYKYVLMFIVFLFIVNRIIYLNNDLRN